MIVNTAYIYMGSAGGPPNPVIFQDDEINYKYSGTNFTVTTNGFQMLTGDSELEFSGLDLSNFEKLSIWVRNGSSSYVTLTINFIDNSGTVSANNTWRISDKTVTNRWFTIPTEYRKPRTKIKISLTKGRNITLEKAILS